jgi:hypothetical protein
MVSRLEAKIHEPVGQLHRTTRSGLKSKIQWFLMIFKGDFSIYVYYVMYIYIYILCSLTLFCPTNVCPLASKYGSRTFLSEWNSHDFMIWIWIYIYRLGIFRCLVRLKDQKLRFASTVSTHSPNMLWAWLAENGFCFFWDFRGGFPSPNPSWLWILILRQTSWSMLERAVLHLWIYCVYGGTLRTSQVVALVCLSTESQDGFWKFTHVDKRHACLPGNHADVPAPSH